MKKRIYERPYLQLFFIKSISPFCLSPNNGDADGTGEDFEWGN